MLSVEEVGCTDAILEDCLLPVEEEIELVVELLVGGRVVLLTKEMLEEDRPVEITVLVLELGGSAVGDDRIVTVVGWGVTVGLCVLTVP